MHRILGYIYNIYIGTDFIYFVMYLGLSCTNVNQGIWKMLHGDFCNNLKLNVINRWVCPVQFNNYLSYTSKEVCFGIEIINISVGDY